MHKKNKPLKTDLVISMEEVTESQTEAWSALWKILLQKNASVDDGNREPKDIGIRNAVNKAENRLGLTLKGEGMTEI